MRLNCKISSDEYQGRLQQIIFQPLKIANVSEKHSKELSVLLTDPLTGVIPDEVLSAHFKFGEKGGLIFQLVERMFDLEGDLEKPISRIPLKEILVSKGINSPEWLQNDLKVVILKYAGESVDVNWTVGILGSSSKP